MRGRADIIILGGLMRLVRRIRARFIYCVQEKAKGNEDGSFAAFRMTRGGVAQARGNKKPGFPACAGNDVLRGRVRGALPSLRSGERRKAENKIQKTRRWILRVAQDDKGLGGAGKEMWCPRYAVRSAPRAPLP